MAVEGGWLRRWHDAEWRSPRETEGTGRELRALLRDSKPGAWPKRSSVLPFTFFPVLPRFLPAQRRRSRFYLTGRSISVDNIITTFRRPKELSGTTIGPRVTNDAKSLRSSSEAGSRKKISDRAKYSSGGECAATIRLSNAEINPLTALALDLQSSESPSLFRRLSLWSW